MTRDGHPRRREIAWGHVRDLLAWEPQEISHDVLRLAREIEQRYATSWWDAMIVAAAQLQDCSWARRQAAERNMSLSRFIGELLQLPS